MRAGRTCHPCTNLAMCHQRREHAAPLTSPSSLQAENLVLDVFDGGSEDCVWQFIHCKEVKHNRLTGEQPV